MTPATDQKLAAALRALRADQMAGKAPPPGEITRAELARRSGVSAATIAAIERIFVARLACALLRDPATPAHLARRAASSLNTEN